MIYPKGMPFSIVVCPDVERDRYARHIYSALCRSLNKFFHFNRWTERIRQYRRIPDIDRSWWNEQSELIQSHDRHDGSHQHHYNIMETAWVHGRMFEMVRIFIWSCDKCDWLMCCSEEIVAHSSNVSSLVLGKSSGRLLATGGEDCRVNIWAISKPNCIMVKP